MNIAVQMYTLRADCEVDFFETLTKVAELGFQGVEFAGFYGKTAEEVRAKMDQLGLLVAGSHTPIDALEGDLEAIIAFNQTIGNKNVICPFSKWEDKAGFDHVVAVLNKASEVLSANGMTLLYHNHAHEFDLLDGVSGLDLLFEQTKAAGVTMELDTHWVARVDMDPVAYMEKYGNRCQLVHLKDLQIVDGEKMFGYLGEGTMDIKKIIETAKNIGVSWLVVENDQPIPNGFDNITKSMAYLKALNIQ